MVFIYGLRDPRDGGIKYIGKSKNPDARLQGHFRNARRRNTPKNAWLLKLRSIGLCPEMVILESVEETDWPRAERYWIAFFRAKGQAEKNLCDGGEGRDAPLSEQARRNISEALRNSERFKAAMKASGAKRKGHSCLTDEGRKRLSDALKGRKFSPEHCQRLSGPRLASRKPKSEQHKHNISRALQGRKVSDETRKKISASRIGWKPTEQLTQIQREKCKGEGNGRAVLSANQVLEIRSRYALGNVTLERLAEDYPVNLSTVHRIVTRRTWKHL